jgi:hypothetical protein
MTLRLPDGLVNQGPDLALQIPETALDLSNPAALQTAVPTVSKGRPSRAYAENNHTAAALLTQRRAGQAIAASKGGAIGAFHCSRQILKAKHSNA